MPEPMQSCSNECLCVEPYLISLTINRQPRGDDLHLAINTTGQCEACHTTSHHSILKAHFAPCFLLQYTTVVTKGASYVNSAFLTPTEEPQCKESTTSTETVFQQVRNSGSSGA